MTLRLQPAVGYTIGIAPTKEYVEKEADLILYRWMD
jgi:hypothetical protein